jgi:hypothetical protein
MHAVVTHVDVHDLAEAKRAVIEEIIPMQKRAAGFLGAYFVDLGGGRAMSVEAWDSEANAKAYAPPEGTEAPGVKVTSVQIGEIIGSA